MGINTPFHNFTDDEIRQAPIYDGVYALYESSTTIYIGKGEGQEGIRGRLIAHKEGYEGECTRYADYFNYEPVFNPSQREAELLQEYKLLWGKLPRCNDIMPTWSPRQP
jgi:hypothetical protein